MTTKILKDVLAARTVPAVPTLVKTPVALLSSRFDTTPSFQTKAELITRIATCEVILAGVQVVSQTSTVVDVTDIFGRDGIAVEVVEGRIMQVL